MVASDVRINDLFKIGIGPSSSHTVGPMVAASAFLTELTETEIVDTTQRLSVVLRGSLAATGEGHGTPGAVFAGLLGHIPATCDPAAVRNAWEAGRGTDTITIAERRITLDPIVFEPREPHPLHPNAIDLTAFDEHGTAVLERTYLSVGGGFIETVGLPPSPTCEAEIPFTFNSFGELHRLCSETGLTIAELVAANEAAVGVDPGSAASEIWSAMNDCIESGLGPGPKTLPGGLGVRRRAPALAARVAEEDGFSAAVARIQLDAMAVNEENALGNRVVTAPTNGAAGIIPAVISHYVRSAPSAGRNGIVAMLLTATALGAIIKSNASISGAQVGCQGEVGSACAMAAGALCAALGGTVAQIGKAAEMGLEHHLGLTCDPIGGLVQVPCIERNAIAAVTAVQAATLTLQEDDHAHLVSFDAAVKTMRDVGADMHEKYKETSLGGLAVSLVEC
ncbi:L-serine ammonia-lyase [Gordonia westfalica]|uniref:L-serine dehydratase n=1 Tax=Gordonia westfalica TaxID=158898 RepID=A0A1H2KXT4_9ACTN|nr:L-serine ammonia-lyase [Gordonia westfalica]SDU73151.1 L-serine dehydratase [Gordonia westfalica]